MGHAPAPAPGVDRHYQREKSDRRWVTGSGGSIPEHPAAHTLLEHGRGHRRRWSKAGKVTGASLDQVQAERLLWRMVDAGLVKVHQRHDSRGDWESYQWTLTERGEKQVGETEEPETVDPSGYLAADPVDEHHPALGRIRTWLESGRVDESPGLARILMALGRQLRRGRRPTARAVSIAAEGDSKAVDLESRREPLEAILACPLEEVFRIRGRAVYAWGAFEIEAGGHRIPGDWSIPWMALTADTLADMAAIHLHADRIVTVENLAAFESYVREERPADTVVVFTSGFPGSLVTDFLGGLVEAGALHIDHWGDLDVGGLRILSHLDATLPCPVRPFRMEPQLLDQLPTRPLTDEDRSALRSWLHGDDAPFRAHLEALLEADAKLEQEAWFTV